MPDFSSIKFGGLGLSVVVLGSVYSTRYPYPTSNNTNNKLTFTLTLTQTISLETWNSAHTTSRQKHKGLRLRKEGVFSGTSLVDTTRTWIIPLMKKKRQGQGNSERKCAT